MASELNRDDYGVIRLHPEEGILELEWLEASADMTDDDFKRSMQRYAELAGEHLVPQLLVDVTKFRHSDGGKASPPGATSTSFPPTTPPEFANLHSSFRQALAGRSRTETSPQRSLQASSPLDTSPSARASSSG